MHFRTQAWYTLYLNKIPTWECKTMNPRSVQEVHIYIRCMRGRCFVTLIIVDITGTWDLQHHPNRFMVTQVCDGRTTMSKKAVEKRNENKPYGGCFAPSLIAPVPAEACRQQPHSQLKVASQTIPHLENQGQSVMESRWTCRSGYLYPVKSLKNYHCHLNTFKNVSVCAVVVGRVLLFSHLLLILNKSY